MFATEAFVLPSEQQMQGQLFYPLGTKLRMRVQKILSAHFLENNAIYPRCAWLHPQRKAKIVKGTKVVRRQEWEIWFVSLINDYIGGKEKRSLGTLGQSSRIVTSSCSLLHISQYPTKMSFTHQLWANFPLWVVWPTGSGGGKNKTKDKIKWAHWHFILSSLEDGLVLLVVPSSS